MGRVLIHPLGWLNANLLSILLVDLKPDHMDQSTWVDDTGSDFPEAQMLIHFYQVQYALTGASQWSRTSLYL